MVRYEYIKCPHCGKPSNYTSGPIWMVIVKDILCSFCKKGIIIKSNRGPDYKPPRIWFKRDYKYVARKEDSGKLATAR